MGEVAGQLRIGPVGYISLWRRVRALFKLLRSPGGLGTVGDRRPPSVHVEFGVAVAFRQGEIASIESLDPRYRRRLVDGAVFAMQSGGPVTVNTATNTTGSLNAGAQLRADILANPNLPSSERSLLRWFDTNVFRQPADYTFGNQAPGHIRADGIVTLNGSLLRTFVPVEGSSSSSGADMLNAPNHPDFLVPGRTLGGPGFGVISGARQARQIQLGLKLTF